MTESTPSRSAPILRRVARSIPRNALGNVLLTGATNATIIVAGLLSGSLLARLLGPEGRGELASMQVWAGVVATFGLIGLPPAIVYLSGRHPERAGTFCATALALSAVSTTILLLVVYAILPVALGAKGTTLVEEARLYLAFVPPAVAGGIALTSLQAQLRLGRWNAMRAASSAVWLTVLAGLAIAGTGSPWHVALASIGWVSATACLFWATLVRSTPGPYTVRIGFSRDLLRYALPSALATVPQQSSLRLDQLVMASLLPPRTLGLYAVAVTWSSALSPVSAAVSDVAFPYLARTVPGDGQAPTVAVLLRLTVAVNVVLATLLALITPLALPIVFGPGFAEATQLTWLLIGAGALAATKAVVADTLRGLGRPRDVMHAELAGFIVFVALLLALINEFGPFGAAAVSALGYAITCVWLFVVVMRVTGTRPAELLVIRRADLTYLWGRTGLGPARSPSQG